MIDDLGRGTTAPNEGMTLSVIVPAYNEEKSIAAAIGTYMSALSRLRVGFELIIVDDSSTDGTGAIADHCATADARIRVVHNVVNVNVGTSILIGYKLARGKIVTHNAVDLPFDPAELERILPMFDQDPDLMMVVVCRTNRTAHSPWRKVTSFVHHWLVRLLYWSRLPDMNFVQVVRRSALDKLPVRARSPAFVTPEMIIRARDAGMRILHYRAAFRRREVGQGNFGKIRDILWTLSDMVSFWSERRARR